MEKVRLDLHLARSHPKLSRSEIKNLILQGRVLVDNAVCKPAHRLRGGERIEIRYSGRSRTPFSAEPEPIPLEVLYEDGSIIVINKPAGLVVHPAAGNWSGTLVNALLWHFSRTSQTGPTGPTRTGIVHRLDKGTSGVMVVAKTGEAQTELMRQFKRRQVKKTYLAIVFGSFPLSEGTISRPLGRDPQQRRKFSSRGRHLREAVTRYRVLSEREGISFLEVSPETGRTHQIRVHLSESGHPIIGDTVYGANRFLSSVKDDMKRERIAELKRPSLHAFRLEFRHPQSGKSVGFEAPLPPDLREVYNQLDLC